MALPIVTTDGEEMTKIIQDLNGLLGGLQASPAMNYQIPGSASISPSQHMIMTEGSWSHNDNSCISMLEDLENQISSKDYMEDDEEILEFISKTINELQRKNLSSKNRLSMSQADQFKILEHIENLVYKKNEDFLNEESIDGDILDYIAMQKSRIGIR